jgi:hypothetical protein
VEKAIRVSTVISPGQALQGFLKDTVGKPKDKKSWATNQSKTKL